MYLFPNPTYKIRKYEYGTVKIFGGNIFCSARKSSCFKIFHISLNDVKPDFYEHGTVISNTLTKLVLLLE